MSDLIQRCARLSRRTRSHAMVRARSVTTVYSAIADGSKNIIKSTCGCCKAASNCSVFQSCRPYWSSASQRG